jgi:hypothetical protein
MKVTSIARKKSTTNPRPISAKGESRAKTLQEGKKKKPSITPNPTLHPPPTPENPSQKRETSNNQREETGERAQHKKTPTK